MKININVLIILLCQFIFQSYVYADGLQTNDIKCEKTPFEIKMLDASHVLYIRIDRLCQDSTKLLGDSLRELFIKRSSETIEGTVLDLRHTASTLQYSSTIGLASLFIPPNTFLWSDLGTNGKYFTVRSGKPYYQRGNDPDYLRDLPDELITAPLAILVSQDTKGAPELLAATFLYIRNALLLGEEFEEGVGNSIDLQNPFYQRIAPIFPITKKIHADEINSLQKQYMEQKTETGFPVNCTAENISNLASTAKIAVRKEVKYPRDAQIRQMEGSGELFVEVNKLGKLLWQQILVSTGNDAFDIAMLEAGQKAKFPAVECAREDEYIRYKIPIHFRLTN